MQMEISSQQLIHILYTVYTYEYYAITNIFPSNKLCGEYTFMVGQNKSNSYNYSKTNYNITDLDAFVYADHEQFRKICENWGNHPIKMIQRARYKNDG